MSVDIEIELSQEEWDYIDKQVELLGLPDVNAYINLVIEEARLKDDA